MSDDQLERVIDAKSRRWFDWHEFWHYKELFYFFTWRDIKIKYKQTVLGFMWAILQPILMMVIFTFFFGKALNVPSQDLPYPVFVFSGLLLWNTFASGLTNSANSMISNSQIIKKVYFPRLVIPVSSILGALFDCLMSFFPFILLLVIYKILPAISSLWCWPAALICALSATLGPGCLLAALNVKYRDFRYIIPFLVQVLFFLTPVIYPVSLLKYPYLQYLLALSPMYAALELFRHPLTHGDLNYLFLVSSGTANLVLLIIGVGYFRKTEAFFADLA